MQVPDFFANAPIFLHLSCYGAIDTRRHGVFDAA
jgi:hypothetical protein